MAQFPTYDSNPYTPETIPHSQAPRDKLRKQSNEILLTPTKPYPKPHRERRDGHQKRRDGYQNDGIRAEAANWSTCCKLTRIACDGEWRSGRGMRGATELFTSASYGEI
jgi:hypothetical protein